MQLITNRMYYGGYSLYYEANVWVASQNIANNSTTLGWSVELKGGNGVYMIDAYGWANLWIAGTKVWDRGSGTFRNGEHASGTHTVYHDAAGNCRVAAAIAGHILQDMSAPEQSMDLPKIPRKAVFIDTSDLTEDSASIKMQYHNPAGNSVSKVEFSIELSNATRLFNVELNKNGGVYTHSFLETYKEKLRQYIGNNKETDIIYVLKTTIGGKEYVGKNIKKFRLTNTSAPTLTGSLSYINLDKTLPNNNVFNLKNNINITLSGKVSAKTGTSIKSLNLKIENRTIINSPDNFTFNVGFLKTSGKVKGELVAVDNRGMVSNKLITYINVYPYARPTVFLKAKRKNNFEDETSIDISGKIQSIVINGQELNTVQVIQYWTSDNANNKATITSIEVNPDGTFTIPTIWKNYPKTEKKTIYVTIKDKYTTVTADTIELARGQAIFRISTADNKLYNNEVKVATIDDIYPVGSIFISTNTTNPATYFGGTWKKFAKGRTLVGLNYGDSDFGRLQKTGGSKTHKLTIDEMPGHRHEHNRYTYIGSGTDWGAKQDNSSGDKMNTRRDTTSYTGGDKPHNNLQPYIVVNMWRRIK